MVRSAGAPRRKRGAGKDRANGAARGAARGAVGAQPKLWGGRFSEATDRLVEAYTSSIAVDARLLPLDVAASIAHARMLGLSDRHIAHRDVPIGYLAAGHEKYDSQYVLDRQPDIIILMDNLSPWPWARSDYGQLASGVIPARVDVLGQERLWMEYEPRAVQIREGEWFDLLVRRDASAVLAKTAPTGPPAGPPAGP